MYGIDKQDIQERHYGSPTVPVHKASQELLKQAQTETKAGVSTQCQYKKIYSCQSHLTYSEIELDELSEHPLKKEVKNAA